MWQKASASCLKQDLDIKVKGSPKKQSDKQENIEELNKNRQGTELNLMQAEEKNETIVLQDINLKVSFLLFNAPLDKSWRNCMQSWEPLDLEKQA